MVCEDAGEIATNLWYSQAKNYSYSDPRLNADTDTFTQVRKNSIFLQLDYSFPYTLQALYLNVSNLKTAS